MRECLRVCPSVSVGMCVHIYIFSRMFSPAYIFTSCLRTCTQQVGEVKNPQVWEKWLHGVPTSSYNIYVHAKEPDSVQVRAEGERKRGFVSGMKACMVYCARVGLSCALPQG